MKINMDLTRLENARKKIGAGLADVGDLSMKKFHGSKPIDVTTGETENGLSDINFISGLQLATLDGNLVTINIFQPHEDKDSLLKNPETRFHFMKCKAVRDMREMKTRKKGKKADGRYGRFVFSNRINGAFKVQPKNSFTGRWGEALFASLEPCQYCLKESNYQGYRRASRSERRSIIGNFDLDVFFEKYSSLPELEKPEYTSGTFPTGGYPHDWRDISRKYRSKCNWTCENCGVDCSGETRLTHAHHISGNTGDCREDNLLCLCAICHSKEPLHQHMKVARSDRRRIRELRVQQGLPAG